MLAKNLKELWEAYLKEERRYDHAAALMAVERFIVALKELPADEYNPWVLDIAEQIVDHGSKIRVRMPFFRDVLFPVLLSGFRDGLPGCARWLAGFPELLCTCEECWKTLDLGRDPCEALLRKAIELDPNDHRSANKLISNIANYLEYSLHELPSGVLYGMNGASIEECNLLNEELAFFCGLLSKKGCTQQYEDLVAKCRMHFSAWTEYLKSKPKFSNYAKFLAANHKAEFERLRSKIHNP